MRTKDLAHFAGDIDSIETLKVDMLLKVNMLLDISKPIKSIYVSFRQDLIFLLPEIILLF